MIALTVGASLTQSQPAYAHGDHGHGGPDELLKIYGLLYRGIQASENQAPEQIPLVRFGQNPLTTNQDSIGLLLQRLLSYEGVEAAKHAACHHDHGTEHEHANDCDHAHHDHAPKAAERNFIVKAAERAATAVGGWIKMIPGFLSLELPAMMVDGFRQYGTSFAIYTGVTELVEHVGLAIGGPAFCKLLQAAYVSTAGVVFNYCRIATSTVPDDGFKKRVVAAYLAARQEVLFKYGSTTRRVSRAEPYLTELRRGSFREAVELLGDDSKFLREYLTATEFWGDVYANLGFEKVAKTGEADFFETGEAKSSLGNQVDSVFTADTMRTGLWRAHRLATLLGAFADILREASGAGADEAIFSRDAMWKLQLTPGRYMKDSAVTYVKYMRVRWMLGAVSKLLDRYKSSLFAVAAADRMNHRELKRLAYRDFLEREILPLLGELAQAGQIDLESKQISALEARVKRALKRQKVMIGTDWDYVAHCARLLVREQKAKL